MIKNLILVLLILPSISLSQYKNIKVNSISNSPEEVSIAINPRHPNNLVAGANINNYYYSFDGGSTWINKEISDSKNGVWGDPVLIFDNNGAAYYFHLSRPSNGQWIDRIVCQRSTDGGMTFGNPGTYMGLNPPKKQDKPWACVDNSNSKWRDNIYVTWTQFDAYDSRLPEDLSNIMFSFSSDAGSTWSDAMRINKIPGDCVDSSNTTEGAVPCVGPNGEIYVSWSAHDKLYFDRSLDGGTTWLDEDITAGTQIGGWVYEIEGIFRCNGLPITQCDISNSPYRGTIYINYSDKTNGENDVDVFLLRSSDGGSSWSDPIRINDDPVGNGKQQFMSWMSVDPVTGSVNIIYYDRRNYEDLNTDVYLARSTDGGTTFENVKISESPFTPVKSVFFGDYIGVNAYNDFTACIWQRLDKGKLSVIYAGNKY
ncbi:MAG TPA: sialidase family protein [Ignavibacteria bacterium]|nr:sialidase family protein [Ignavibacteria bacterium]